MATKLKEAILAKLEGVSAQQIERVLQIIGDVPLTIRGQEPLTQLLPPHSVMAGYDLSTSEVYRAMFDTSVNHVVQLERKDALFELILSGLLSRQPDELVKPESTFLLQKFVQKKAHALSSLALSFSNSSEKLPILQRVEEFLLKNSALKNLTPKILQIADELIMNALFDAPVGRDGERLFINTPRTDYVEYYLRSDRAKLKVHYDDTRILIGCEDPWGSMIEPDLRGHLARVTKDVPSQSVSVGQGAGLGLKMIIENSTSLYIMVRRKVLTAVYCGFDLSVSYRKLEETPKHAHIVFVG